MCVAKRARQPQTTRVTITAVILRFNTCHPQPYAYAVVVCLAVSGLHAALAPVDDTIVVKFNVTIWHASKLRFQLRNQRSFQLFHAPLNGYVNSFCSLYYKYICYLTPLLNDLDFFIYIFSKKQLGSLSKGSFHWHVPMPRTVRRGLETTIRWWLGLNLQ